MNNLQTTNPSNLINWDDKTKLQEIRKLFAPKLSDMEFQFFVGLGKATGLNPFTREIWSIKYQDNMPAQVFIGRDGYRKAAQAHSDYDYHQCDAVYANDDFEVVNGVVNHKYKLANRGALVGAYCIAKRHKSSKPMYVFVELAEYTTGRSVWKDKPATMIKKVAESQCLRAAFQDLLGGTYGEEEMQRMEAPQVVSSKSEALMNKIKAAKGQVLEAEPIDISDAEVILDSEFANSEQLKEIHALISCKVFEDGRLTKALEHYGVEKLADLTIEQAQDFIERLNKLEDR